MGRSRETRRMREDAKEARKTERMKHAAEKFAEEREYNAPAIRPLNKNKGYICTSYKLRRLLS